MRQVNISECRAKDPHTCYYHGAYLRLEETMQRIQDKTANGQPVDPEDWNTYYSTRQRIEDAEAELEKRRWMKTEGEYLIQNDDTHTNLPPTTPIPTAQTNPQAANNEPEPEDAQNQEQHTAPQQDATKPTTRKSKPRTYKKTPSKRTKPHYKKNSKYTGNKKRRPERQALLNRPYNPEIDKIFPQQIVHLTNERGNPVTLIRSDKANFIPKGIMLAAPTNITPKDQQYLAACLKYQHTISTRTTKGTRPLEAEDIVVDHSSRSVYSKTRFSSKEQVLSFQDGLNNLILHGSQKRKDGTQKIKPLGKGHKVVVYYSV